MTEPVPVWTFPRDIDPATAAKLAIDEVREPDLRVQVLSTREDGITVQVIAGAAPVQPADDVLYVARRGLFEIVRREDWPGGRVLLALASWPRVL